MIWKAAEAVEVAENKKVSEAAKAAEAAGSAEVAWASAATFGFAEAAAIAKANRSYGALIIIAMYRVEEKYATNPKSKISLQAFIFFSKNFCH